MTQIATAERYEKSPRQLEREKYRRSKHTRSRLTAIACTVLAAAVVGAVVVASPGFASVRTTFLDGHEFVKSFPGILNGFWLNVQMFLIAEIFILILGLAVALVRITKAPGLLPLRLLATLYVDVFRGTPTLLIIFVV